MISTGNDIVCMSATDIPRTKQSKFYSRILSPSEQALYNQAANTFIPFEYYVWLLWSIKESAFKYLQRINPLLVFSPTKFVVIRLDIPAGFLMETFSGTSITQTGFDSAAVEGVIICAGHELSSRSMVYQDVMVSVVNNNEDFDNICWGIKLIDDINPETQSVEVRSFAMGAIRQHCDGKPIAIRKNPDGIPLLSFDEGKTVLPISLSHHGAFVGFSFHLC